MDIVKLKGSTSNTDSILQVGIVKNGRIGTLKNIKETSMECRVREDGFYWVREAKCKDWDVAEYEGGDWLMAGDCYRYKDFNFEEIDEMRIDRDEK